MTAADSDATHQMPGAATVLPAASVRCVLVVVEGPDAGQQFVLEDVAMRRALIGQSPACDVRLTDRAVSRRHAALEGDSRGIRLIDLGSSNGSSVNGVRIRDAYLAGGEIVRLGGSALRLDIGETPNVLPAPEDRRFGRLLGASPAMRRLYPTFERLAASTIPVLIEGETGTGKEVLAEALHEAGPRSAGPFVVFDCTTVSGTLVDAELFGHERGAFTGAVQARAGLFEEADRGTIFIDEIGDLGSDLQSKLLRAIERSEVRRVGSSRWTQVDVRVICATRRDLDAEVQARRFRDDLFYRLAVARVELPPLQKRQGDIALLTRAFWVALGGDLSTLSPDLVQRFEAYDWPGNVRELHNAIARHLALGESGVGSATPMRDAGSGPVDFLDKVIGEGMPFPRAREEVLAELERRCTAHALKVHDGNVGSAAAALGIGRRYFQKLRARH